MSATSIIAWYVVGLLAVLLLVGVRNQSRAIQRGAAWPVAYDLVGLVFTLVLWRTSTSALALGVACLWALCLAVDWSLFWYVRTERKAHAKRESGQG